ncbi:MAG: DUF7483 domain-containing protein [Fluviibacter sp.]
MSGYYSNDSVGPVTGFLQKFDSTGTSVWARSFILTNSSGKKVRIDSSDNIYVFSTGTSGGYQVAIVLKYNTSGTLQWQRQISYSSANLNANDMSLDPSGNIYLTGSAPAYTGYNSIFVISYNSSGTVRWQNQFAYVNSNWTYVGYGVCANATNVYATGVSNQGTYSITTLKLKSDGTASGGNAFLTAFPGSLTASSGSATASSIGMGTATPSVVSTSSSIAVSTSSMTATTYTQNEVLSSSGLVWIKGRSGATDHALFDTVRGATNDIATNLTSAQTTQSTGLTSFSANGFTIGSLAKVNTSSATYVAWSWRETPKFFDIVQFTGTGVARTISHNLGSVPGMIIVKPTSESGSWVCYHRIVGNASAFDINAAAGSYASTAWNSTTPTDTVFSLGANTTVNKSGATYIAYIFAHNAGGFGLTGTDNVISCGSFVPDVTPVTVTLGWEPQLIFYQNITAPGGSPIIFDNMRGMYATGGNSARLNIDSSGAESNSFNYANITSTGFTVPSGLTTGATYMYVAVRRGPMKVPTSATTVFNPVVYTGSNSARTISAGFAPDGVWFSNRTAVYWGQNTTVFDRLRGFFYSVSSGTIAETDLTPFVTGYGPTGIDITISGMNNASAGANAYVDYFFGRAPGFMDLVTYTGNLTSRTISHNLNAVPELIIFKSRSATGAWFVYNATIGSGQYLIGNTASGAAASTAIFNNTSPTSSVFSIGANSTSNQSGTNYIAYLFTSCTGVSKVGTYTGTGATQTISCGFTGGARFVLVKRTDSSGDWYIWDSSRGMVAGTDPSTLFNSAAAEVNANSVYTTTGGFQIVSTASGINASGGTYIYLAIA